MSYAALYLACTYVVNWKCWK